MSVCAPRACKVFFVVVLIGRHTGTQLSDMGTVTHDILYNDKLITICK